MKENHLLIISANAEKIMVNRSKEAFSFCSILTDGHDEMKCVTSSILFGLSSQGNFLLELMVLYGGHILQQGNDHLVAASQWYSYHTHYEI